MPPIPKRWCDNPYLKGLSYSSLYIIYFLIYGKPAEPGAESHYEFCHTFPQNAHTLIALESSIFIGFLFFLRSSDLDPFTTCLDIRTLPWIFYGLQCQYLHD